MKKHYLLRYIEKFFKTVRTTGLSTALKKARSKTRPLLSCWMHPGQLREREIQTYLCKLNTELNRKSYRFIDIIPTPFGWDTPLFQRFQHFSLQAEKHGGFALYGGLPLIDGIRIVKEVAPGFHIFNAASASLKNALLQFLAQRQEPVIMRIQSVDETTSVDDLQNALTAGFHVVYEYIDEISPLVFSTGEEIPAFIQQRHDWCLKNSKITVVASSDKLYSQACQYRKENILILNNGVEPEHWHCAKNNIHPPKILQKAIRSGKIIAAYHGALAEWLDYDLLRKIAEDGRFALLLIGHLHNAPAKCGELLKMKNVYYTGAVPYNKLNSYAAFYDIALLPFQVDDFTRSVSPVKIFEYMAAGVPIVSSALPECLKYKSCRIGFDHERFIQQMEYAVSLRKDNDYPALLAAEAQQNSWYVIYGKILDHLLSK